MTERLLARGVFPILSQRPLEDSEVASVATSKVYVVEVGAYSNRYVDAVFTTRELAEAYVEGRARRDYGRYVVREERVGVSYHAKSRPDPGRPGWFIYEADLTSIADPGALVPKLDFPTWFRRANEWNEYGDVAEYDLWDVAPIVSTDVENPSAND